MMMQRFLQWSVRPWLFAIMLCVGFFYMVYAADIEPLQQKLNSTFTANLHLKTEQKYLFYQQVSLEESIARFAQTQQLLRDWRRKLISKHDLPKLLKEITSTGKSDKLKFTAFNAGVTTESSDYVTTVYQLNVTGHYSDLADFIEKIAEMPWLISVGDFVVTPTNNALWSADLTLNIYMSISGRAQHHTST
jgi:type IV pilus assembly protein PilO